MCNVIFFNHKKYEFSARNLKTIHNEYAIFVKLGSYVRKFSSRSKTKEFEVNFTRKMPIVQRKS